MSELTTMIESELRQRLAEQRTRATRPRAASYPRGTSRHLSRPLSRPLSRHRLAERLRSVAERLDA